MDDKRVITSKDTRRKHSEALKRDLVARTLMPGASVAALAQEAGINANLLFNWRRLHLRAQGAMCATAQNPTLVPVTLKSEALPPAPRRAVPATPSHALGTIEIEIGAAHIHLLGHVDEASLCTVVRALRELA